MKLLIMGGNGMAGHMLVDYFRLQGRHQVFYTTRNNSDDGGLIVDMTDSHLIEQLIEMVRPHVIINAVGVLNQEAEKNPIDAYYINGILPHRIRNVADRIGARVMHISTDCVFSGTRGSYTETDAPDGMTVYAMSKALGEIHSQGHLTIRTSIIGPEIRAHRIGLLDWFLKQKGDILGYQQVFWNGITTLELAKSMDFFLEKELSGLIHLVQSKPINKYDLLLLFQVIWDKGDVRILPDTRLTQDKTLVNTRKDLHYEVPSYEMMLRELECWMRAS